MVLLKFDNLLSFRGDIYSVPATVQYSYGQFCLSHCGELIHGVSEANIIATIRLDCRPKMWKRYVDDILEISKK